LFAGVDVAITDPLHLSRLVRRRIFLLPDIVLSPSCNSNRCVAFAIGAQ
jgi:hypothetical protein